MCRWKKSLGIFAGFLRTAIDTPSVSVEFVEKEKENKKAVRNT